jgi:glycosyltransferase involved in cell wall biosynthesis
VGRLIEEKGIADLIEAVGYAKRLGESCTLDIVGSGIRSFTVKMQQLVERLGLRQQVTFHGPKEEPEVLEFMLTRRLFVYPSYADAYPLGLLESIAAGMYPIAYGIPGTSEIVAEYGGCLVRKGDVEGLARAVVSGLRRDDPACSWRVRQRLDPRCVAREYRQLAFQ